MGGALCSAPVGSVPPGPWRSANSSEYVPVRRHEVVGETTSETSPP